ncbi:ABC transporter permease [Leptolyngbya sp. 15MV]|nr:ABC transporter permease [Leptolyngbya sp. 15MV]
MITQILSIARTAFVESIRQPIFFVLVLVAAVLQFFNTATAAFSMGYTESGEFSGDTKWLLDIGLGTVFVLGTLLAAFVSTAVVSREIENKTVLTVVSKPIPRPLVVIGKYLGVAASLLIAVGCMLIFLLLALRHGVLTAVADEYDPPVLIFGFAALLGSIAIAAWCNYFYGWYFSHTAMVAMLPLLLVAYVLVLLLNKQWEWQPITTDLKPQTLFACLGLTMAILALAALATAVSTRLGQVMTIIVCASVFLFGLLSNYLIGRHVSLRARRPARQPRRLLRPGLRLPGSARGAGCLGPVTRTPYNTAARL